MTGKIQHTVDAFHKCVLSACQVPDIVLDTNKNQTNKYIGISAGVDNCYEE